MIDWLIDFSLRNRFLILGLTLLLVAAGLYTVRTNPIDAIPDISETQVIVFAEWPGRSPQEVEDQVTYPMTTNLQGLAGVKAVRASSAFGFSMVNVIFEDGTDLYFGRQRILERMNLIQGLMPKGVTPVLGPDASAVGQVFWYTLEGEGHDLGELRALQDWFVRYQLNAVPGVAEVASIGGFVREYQIDLDPNKLAAYGVSLRDVMTAVARSNDNVGGKVIEQNGMEYVVRGVGLIRGLRDIGNIAVSASGGVPVYLSSLGAIQLGSAFRRGALEKNGREVVGGVVTMRYGQSAPEIIARVKAKIREVQKGLPAGVRIVPAYDRSALIARAIGTLKRSLIEETLLVVLAHVLFLMHFRSVLIVSAPLPIAVLIAFILMRVFGITSNIMSLMGIAIAIGVLVDAGIVITENCFRQIEREGGTRPLIDSVRDATQRTGRPIFFSMVIIILAFFPVFSLTGEEGRLFHPLAFTKTFAMIGATFLSVTLVPVLATFLIRGKVRPETQNPIMRVARRLYEPALDWALRHKKTTLLLAGGVFVLSLLLVGGAGLLLTPVKLPFLAAAAAGSGGAQRVTDRLASGQQWLDSHLAAGVGNELMPPLDEGTLMFMPVTSNAVSLTEAVEIMKRQDAVLRSFPEVASVIGKVGRVESPLDPAPINMYETLVELKDREHWRPDLTRDALIAEMTEKSLMPGVTTIWQQPIRNRIDMLATGIPTQVGIKVFGPDLAVLERKAREVAEAVREVRGAVDVYPEQILGTPYLEIEVDRDAVARYGATVADVEEVVEAAIGGMDLTTTIEGRNRFAVRVRYARELRDDLGAIRRVLVPVRSPVGGGSGMTQVPLAELASIRLRPGPSMISSENGLLRARIFLNVRGRDVGSFVDEATRTVEQKVSLPAGYYLQGSGQYENQVRARNRLMIVVPACFAIIFVLLWLTYRSAKEAAHVILAIPFALTGGNLLLWALHTAALHFGWKTELHLSVAVWVGYIALFGTAVQTAVVMVVYLEEALQRKAAAGELTCEGIREAAMEGAVLRLRPKLMTVATVIAGLLPILWSSATGSEVAKPIATPVVGGMLSSLVHVLIVTPVLWTMLKEWELRRGRLEVTPSPPAAP
ncbi:MAG TPA: efflux RND transporter permease subunit [Thermoanaerobaculia bacterium]|jgi:Cu(I)/Ag(I) efflux system membrane protein CusA/SilA|nr:efflux RND transporter permease subunit [Thermoanaerobaculia bacterium]